MKVKVVDPNLVLKIVILEKNQTLTPGVVYDLDRNTAIKLLQDGLVVAVREEEQVKNESHNA